VIVADYGRAWLDSRLVKGRPLASRTRYEYEGSAPAKHSPHLRLNRLRAIGTSDVRTWLAEVIDRAGNDQAAKSYRMLRAVLNTAVTDPLLVRNPCQIRGAGQWHPPERPMVATELVLQLADAIVEVDKTKHKTGSSRLRALILLAGFAASRPGELVALRCNDIDLLHQLVIVDENAPEVGGRRTLGPPKSDAGKRRVSIPSSIRATWRLASTASSPPSQMYDLRHHAATLTARIPGVTSKELMFRIGHSSPRAALLYQHATAERDKRIADAIDAAIDEAASRTTVLSFGSPHAPQGSFRRSYRRRSD
jgi:integrase